MEIPGIAPFSGQPTLTNPLSSENQLLGRQTTAVVNEATQNESVGFDPENPGGTIDITV
jgi:hypothetical protein